MKDLAGKITLKRCISPVSESANNALVGQIIDKQGFESLTYAISTGSLATDAATFTVLLEHGDAANLSDAVAVPDIDLLGTEALAGFIGTDDNKCRKLGYIGAKRYTRLTITPASNAAAALISATAILGHAQIAPQPNPPV